MNIGDLDYDILYRVFRIIASRAEGLVEVSSVCRYWRRLILPHLYDILYVRHSNGVLQSDVQSGSSNEYTKYARELCIHLYDVYIDSSKFITILKKSGIDQAVWPQIRKLEINSYINLEDHGTGADVDSKKAAKDAADILLKHLPNISEIKVSEVTDDYEWDLCHRNPILLVPELASRYSTQLHKIDLFIDSVWLSKGISLPQPLTHLAIVTSDRDSQVLTKIFAPTLQFFRITQLTPDIMWSWFDSGNEKSDIVWFNSLLDLEIGFYDQDHKYYCGTQKSSHRTNDPSDIDQSEAGSEHRYTNKRVHFPVLRRLKLGHYPYVDGSFCDLFIDCPLQEIDITWCNGVGHHLPPQIKGAKKALAELKRLIPDAANAANKALVQQD
ncbi:hypothetical protein GGI12_003339 [Dipsacomyces acuminosporus]|nr:hypothetical protein GGI12_003339 [Dipsacomyces acuminosporus]